MEFVLNNRLEAVDITLENTLPIIARNPKATDCDSCVSYLSSNIQR